MNPVSEIIECLQERDTWYVLAHEKPDGDTLGCAAALSSLGKRLGKNVVMGGRDAVPAQYEFLTGDVPYKVMKSLPADISGDAVAICVDTSNCERSVACVLAPQWDYLVVNIDHHVDNTLYGDINWVDREASATGEMIVELMAASAWGVSPYEAMALYTAIVSDNGWFSFASTTARSHECAKFLIEAGAQPNETARALDSNMTAGALHLWGLAFSRAETFAGGEGALFWLEAEDFAQTGTVRDQMENLVNSLLRIKGVRLAALVSEDGGQARVNLRARSPLSARSVAAVFGGGGHDLSAGCKAAMSVSSLLPVLRGEMEKHIADRLSGDR